jgi:hypothetical protein
MNKAKTILSSQTFSGQVKKFHALPPGPPLPGGQGGPPTPGGQGGPPETKSPPPYYFIKKEWGAGGPGTSCFVFGGERLLNLFFTKLVGGGVTPLFSSRIPGL